MSEANAGKGGQVTYDRQGHVGTITLNRPDKRNALNPRVWDALDEAIAQAEQDAEARVVLLRGEGKSFCAGLDLSPDNELFPSLPTRRVRQTRWSSTGRSGGFRAIHTGLEAGSSRQSRSCRGTAWGPDSTRMCSTSGSVPREHYSACRRAGLPSSPTSVVCSD